MIPQKKRIKGSVFRVLIKKGKIFSTKLFLFYFMDSKFPQYSFVAPLTIFKNAVERNKFRRIGYNIIRSIQVESGTGIFVYKKQAITTSLPEIKEDIIYILKKAKLL
jgi:ribonuclease P protein component